MMAGTGSLVAVGTVHLLLLLSCLDTSVSVPVRLNTRNSLFVPYRFIWQNADFSLVSVNKSIVFWLNNAANKLQALSWPDSVIHLPKGVDFSGYLYFRDSVPGTAVFEFLPFSWLTSYDVTEDYDDTDYCISIDINEYMIYNIPGYKREQLMPSCLQCNIWSCPESPGPCECGYYAVRKDPTGNYNQTQRKFIGVRWVDVDDPRWTVP